MSFALLVWLLCPQARAGLAEAVTVLHTDPGAAWPACAEATRTKAPADAGWMCVGVLDASGNADARALTARSLGRGPAFAAVYAAAARLPALPTRTELEAVGRLADRLEAETTTSRGVVPLGLVIRRVHAWALAVWEPGPGAGEARHRLTTGLRVVFWQALKRSGDSDAAKAYARILARDAGTHWGGSLDVRVNTVFTTGLYDDLGDMFDDIGDLLVMDGFFPTTLFDEVALYYRNGARHPDSRLSLAKGTEDEQFAAYERALAIAEAEGTAGCRLSVRLLWAQSASLRNLTRPTSLDSLEALPDLTGAFFAVQGDLTGVSLTAAHDLRSFWIRAVWALKTGGREDAAFRTLAALQGRRPFVWRHLQAGLEQPNAALQATWDTFVAVARRSSFLSQLRPSSTTRTTGFTAAEQPGVARLAAARRRLLNAAGPPPAEPSLAAIQARLRVLKAEGAKDPTLLAWFSRDHELFLERITADDWSLKLLDTPPGAPSAAEAAKALAQTVASAIQDPTADATLWGALHGLHQLLIVPADVPKNAFLLVVAEDILANVPFEALVSAPFPTRTDRDPWKDAPYLGNSHLLVHVPSSAWPGLPRLRPPPASRTALFVGKMDFKRSQSPYLFDGAAPMPELSGVGRELEEVEATLAPHIPLRTLCDSGCDGTPSRSAFFEEVPRYGIVHIATHAASDGSLWLRQLATSSSYLRLGTPKKEELVWSLQIETLRLAADLVVLSACDTRAADGDVVEGALGLSRSFLAAGARTVIASHWGVSDALPPVFFPAFYAAYVKDSSPLAKVAAFHRAQMTLKSGRFSHPRDWAAFTLIGDPD